MDEATLQLYEDVEGNWRWRLVGPSRHVYADGDTVDASREAVEERLSQLRALAAEISIDRALEGAVVIGGDDRWTFRVIDGHGRLQLVGPEAYPTRDAVTDAIDRLIDAATATTLDRRDDRLVTDEGVVVANTTDATDLSWVTSSIADAPVIDDRSGAVLVYRGHDDEVRWRAMVNNTSVAESGEGYATAADAATRAREAFAYLPSAAVDVWG